MQNQVPKNWQKVKLNDLGFVGRGKSKHRPRNDSSLYGGKYPFIQTSDVKNANLYIADYSQTYNDNGLSQSKLWDPGTLLITIAANIAETAILKIPACFPDSIVGFIADPKKSDTRFVKYYIDIIKLNMQSASKGTTQDNLSLDKLLTFDFFVPEEGVQRKIASVLSAYDDLIENNNKQIKILEETAQAIFKEWFVHFRFPGYEEVKMVDSGTEYGMTPENWESKKLGDKLNILKGKNITKNTIIHGKVPVVAGGLNPAYYHNKANTQCPVITISASGANSGFVNLYQEDVWVSDCSYIDRKTTPFVYFYYLFLKNKQIEITGLQRGSAQPHVYPKDLMQLTIIDIPEMIINAFEQKVELMFNALKNLKNQNQCLRKTRDLLLPKLMKGEIRL